MTTEQYPANRLDRERAALLLIDHQVGLLLGVHDELRRNVIALARIAKAYPLAAVLTTSMADGPNGALLPELATELPDTLVIHRHGEIDPFDNADFRAAVASPFPPCPQLPPGIRFTRCWTPLVPGMRWPSKPRRCGCKPRASCSTAPLASAANCSTTGAPTAPSKSSMSSRAPSRSTSR
jgi:hypothetical protein